jgi:4'-phosphopantetheinyl transferase
LAAHVIALWFSSSLSAPQLARHALGGSLDLLREPGGKPYLPDGPHISLAHSRTAAAVALSTLGPVGVDLEPDRDRPTAGLARHWFTAPEAEWIALHPDDFLPLWTLKEAVGKALGTGLRGGGLRRPMPLPPPTDLSRLTHNVSGVCVTSGRHDGHVLAIACTEPSALDSAVDFHLA